MQEISDLSKKQERALVELLNCLTVKEVAQKLKVSEATLYRWMQDDNFRTHYRAARRKIVEQALGQLQKATGEAVKTLLEVMQNAEASPHARVASARTILEFSIKAVELEDLSERVEILEGLLEERNNEAR